MKITTLAFAAVQAVCATLSAVPAASQSAPYSGHRAYLDHGWTPDTGRWWYFLSQGTAFMPYPWFLALEQATGTELFSAPGHMQRFGFLIEPPDPRYNPAGLPVGFAKAVLDVDRNRYACWK